MICIPWKIVFPNLVIRVLQLNNKELPLGLWLVFLISVVPLAAVSYHLIEKPARERMKLMADSLAARRPSAATA
jgi:peptidoglycan/LPS O-acetylase OafA/YrhL